jgi:hypothetical protein
MRARGVTLLPVLVSCLLCLTTIPAMAQGPKAAARSEWETTLELGKKEGKVVVSTRQCRTPHGNRETI